MRKAVITGIGVVSPIGSTLEDFWDGLKSGTSGIGKIDCFDASEFSVQIAAQVKGFNCEDFVSRKEQRRMDKYCHYALAAARMAMDDAGIAEGDYNPELMGSLVGSGVGGVMTMETQSAILADKGPSRVSPFTIPQMISNMASGLVAIQHNLKGPNYCVVSACATAAGSSWSRRTTTTRH